MDKYMLSNKEVGKGLLDDTKEPNEEWIGADSDITARKRVEEALRESELKYRYLFDSIDEGFCIIEVLFDDNEQPYDYRYLEVNSAFERQTGLVNAQGRCIRELVPYIEQHWFNIYGYVAKTGESTRFQNSAQELGRFFDAYAFRIGEPEKRQVAVLFNDITERRRLEKALLEREEKCRELVKHAPSGIYELDFRNNRFISINDVMYELTGYSKEELQNMSPSDLLDTEGKKLARKRMDEWLLGRKPEPHVDYKVRTKDGRALYVSLNVSFTRDENGQPLGAMEIAHDVTVRKKMEEALRRNGEELRNADKIKNNFISVLSHELRNPLATISAGISILEMSENKLQTEKAKEIIKRQIGQLCKLVDDLLDLTRITQNKIQLKKEDIIINNLLMDAAKDAAFLFDNKGVQFSVEIQEKPMLIYADPVRITQIIGNLLYNALKFTPGGGAVLLSLTQDKDQAVIMVKDNGIGVSKEILPNLFKPFTQADNLLDRQNNGGLGLGLYIVKGIVDMHEGNVTASSEGLGKGSLFTIRLPVT